MPGTELAFAGDVACLPTALLGWKTQTIHHRTAIFRQVNKDKSATHHDALEFPDGRTVLLTLLCEGQAATVLQLPARPMSAAEEDAQKRVTYVGWQFRLDLLRPPYEAAYFFHVLERRAWSAKIPIPIAASAGSRPNISATASLWIAARPTQRDHRQSGRPTALARRLTAIPATRSTRRRLPAVIGIRPKKTRPRKWLRRDCVQRTLARSV